MRTLRDRIIKALGGYTKKEYTRVENKYQALIDSKSTESTVQIANEQIYRVLRDLDIHARSSYGMLADEWCKRMYNIIHNNMLRILIRYVNCGSLAMYTIDTTLDNEKEFAKIMSAESRNDALELINKIESNN